MLVGKIRSHLTMQHANLRCFPDFGDSLADFRWFCGLIHVCMRILLSLVVFRGLDLENGYFT